MFYKYVTLTFTRKWIKFHNYFCYMYDSNWFSLISLSTQEIMYLVLMVVLTCGKWILHVKQITVIFLIFPVCVSLHTFIDTNMTSIYIRYSYYPEFTLFGVRLKINPFTLFGAHIIRFSLPFLLIFGGY